MDQNQEKFFNVQKLKNIPHKPGCYLWLDKNLDIIYIGKAKNLNKRMHSYFNSNVSFKTSILVKQIFSFNFIVTENEKESLILESSLLRKHKPKYNIKIKNSSMYPYVVLEKSDSPRLFTSYGLIKNRKTKYSYFGPFPSGTNIREIVELLNNYYPFRKCNRNNSKNCLYEDIGKCLGFSKNEETKKKYANISKEVKDIFNGNKKKLQAVLNEMMKNEAKFQNFEESLRIKNIIKNSDFFLQKSSVTLLRDTQSYDIFNYYSKDNYIAFHILFIRNGEISAFSNFISAFYTDELVASNAYLKQYYENSPRPKNIIVPPSIDLSEISLLYDIKIIYPEKGSKKKLITMAYENSKEYFNKEIILEKLKQKKFQSSLDSLKKVLSLKSIKKIEMFDNSSFFSDLSVSGMVSFANGVPNKNEYRKYNLNTNNFNSDYDHIKEVVYRRYYHLMISKLSLPNLIIVDGGMSQYSAAKSVLNSLKLDIPLLALAKNKNHKTSYMIYEGKKVNITSSIEQLLISFQEEAHRFAISFSRNKNSKKI